MDHARFEEAQQAYDAGDFRSAAKGFLASAGRGTVGNGAAYHMAGNALMRLRRYSDAVTVYGHALRDEMYDKRGAVCANLGAAYVALGELSQAIESYQSALEESDYPTPYKAWQGIASAHMERGRAEEAAGAYRRAALDETNPDPGKALVNLGLCFMALDRPSDAADAYKAALGFDDYAGRGKALANLGQAYVAMGKHEEAARAFEKATQLHGHRLSPGAQQAFDTAAAAVRPQHETVEGWVTGEMPPVSAGLNDPSGWESGELSSLDAVSQEVIAEKVADPAPVTEDEVLGSGDDVAANAADALGFGDDAAVTDFFSRSEAEMKAQDREARRAERTATGGRAIRTSIFTAVAVLALSAGMGAAYFLGFGWPTQTSTVNGLLVAYSKGEPVDEYWVAVPEGDVEREMAKVPPVKEFSIDAVDSGRAMSTVRVTISPEQGAEMRYTVTLAREGVGWRVTGIEYNWRSTGG